MPLLAPEGSAAVHSEEGSAAPCKGLRKHKAHEANHGRARIHLHACIRHGHRQGGDVGRCAPMWVGRHPRGAGDLRT